MAKHLGGNLDYVDPDHPVQRAVRSAIEEMCGEQSPGFGIDGCSAPNFAVSLTGMATAMARIASTDTGSHVRDRAATALRDAMIAHPEMVGGKGRAATELMLAANGRAALKDGAEGVFVAMLPDLQLGIALKIEDGAERGAEVAMTALLTRLGILEAEHPTVARYLKKPIRNWDGLLVGEVYPVPGLA